MMTPINETTMLPDIHGSALPDEHNYYISCFYGGDYFFDDDEHAELKRSVKIVSLVIYSLVFVLGVLGNGGVIWVTGFKMRKTVNTVWYLNLAVADFLFTVLVPLRITESALDGHWPFGSFMCKLNSTVLYLNMYASIYNLMVISIDRCVCAVWPIWAQKHRNIRKASCVSLGVWVLALALSSPYFIFYDTHDTHYITTCRPNFALTDEHGSAVSELVKFRLGTMIITRFLMGFVVPFNAIITCYAVLIHRLRKTKQSRHPIKTIAAVITAFFLCWAPYHILQLSLMAMAEGDRKIETLELAAIVVFCLAYINSCLNPLLYVFVGQDFKNEIRRSVLKRLEKAFAEETSTPTNPGTALQIYNGT